MDDYKISDLIKMLQDVQQEHGDLEVSVFDEYNRGGGEYTKLGGVEVKKLKKKTVLEIF